MVSDPLPAGAPSARLIVEPDDGVKPVVEFIRGASQTLDVAMYLLSDHDVVDALEASQGRGVRVRVMLEENPFGTGPGNRAVFDRLKAANVATQWGPPNFRFNHEKYAVADRKVALVGTANWTHSAFTANREYLVEDSDPRDVAQLAALFDADWERQVARIDDRELVISPVNSRADFQALAKTAKQTLDLESEEMQDTGIESVLADAAKRGVQVRVVIPSPVDQSDANAVGAQRLGVAGVQVRHLRNPYVHGKEVVIDGREAFVGSENFSESSLDENREVGLLIEDSATVQRVEETFHRDWEDGKP